MVVVFLADYVVEPGAEAVPPVLVVPVLSDEPVSVSGLSEVVSIAVEPPLVVSMAVCSVGAFVVLSPPGTSQSEASQAGIIAITTSINGIYKSNTDGLSFIIIPLQAQAVYNSADG